jgi:hypothetical protein
MKIQCKLILLLLLIGIICISFGNFQPVWAGDPPYPESPLIASITWHWDTYVRLALGSDLWPVTWAADGNIYCSWGDGVGFGAVDFDEQWGPDRASLGFSRIEGYPPNFTTANVWGGKNAENPATFDGKAAGMLSVNGTLYAWINIQNTPNHWDYQLAWSSNFGATWQKESWKFPGGLGNFFPQAFLNFGKDYAGARDNFVYFYGRTWGNTWIDGTPVHLGCVEKDKIKDRSAYKFFIGLDGDGKPLWTADINERQPVFVDPNGILTVSVVFNSALNRYIMTASHGNLVGKLGVFDAPEPWGPWTTVAYYEDWGGFGDRTALFYHCPTKWISSDGKTMWCIFSSNKELDSFNLVKATLTLKTQAPWPPAKLRIMKSE